MAALTALNFQRRCVKNEGTFCENKLSSTCSFSADESEENESWVLEKSDGSILRLSPGLQKAYDECENASEDGDICSLGCNDPSSWQNVKNPSNTIMLSTCANAIVQVESM